MKKKTTHEFTEVELLEIKPIQKVGVTLEMLAMEARMKGRVYFRFNPHGPVYQLKIVEDELSN